MNIAAVSEYGTCEGGDVIVFMSSFSFYVASPADLIEASVHKAVSTWLRTNALYMTDG